MPGRRTLLLTVVGYVAFGLAVFLVALYFTFPYDVLRERLAAEVQQATGLSARIGAVRPQLPAGIVIDDLRLYPTPQATAPFVRLARVTASSVLDLLQGRPPSVEFVGQAAQGNLTGSVLQEESRRTISLQWREVDLGQLQPLLGSLPFQLTGRSRGTLRLASPGNDHTRGSGSAELQVERGSFRYQSPGGLKLPEVSFTGLQLRLDLGGGQLRLREGRVDGTDLQVTALGQSVLRRALGESPIAGQLRLRLTPALRQRAPELGLLVAGAPDPEGFATYTLTGTLAAPRLLPR